MQECDVYIGKGLKLAGTRNSVIAPGFSAYVEYKKGQLVMRDGDLYVAPKDLAPGPWNDEDWIQTSLGQEIPRNTSQLENDSGFCKVVASTEPPAEGTPDDVLTALLDGEVSPLSGNWENITDKLGQLSPTATGGRIIAYFNRVLRLIHLSVWGAINVTDNNTKLFLFNSDIPGNNENRTFSEDCICRVVYSGSSSIGYCRIRPFATPEEPNFSYAISVESSLRGLCTFDGILVITPIKVNYDEFCAYLDSKD